MSGIVAASRSTPARTGGGGVGSAPNDDAGTLPAAPQKPRTMVAASSAAARRDRMRAVSTYSPSVGVDTSQRKAQETDAAKRRRHISQPGRAQSRSRPTSRRRSDNQKAVRRAASAGRFLVTPPSPAPDRQREPDQIDLVAVVLPDHCFAVQSTAPESQVSVTAPAASMLPLRVRGRAAWTKTP